MFIWRVERPEGMRVDWDEYISFIAIAPDESTVRCMHPANQRMSYYVWNSGLDCWCYASDSHSPSQEVPHSTGWIKPHEVVPSVIGIAHDLTTRIEMTSYKAG